MRGIFRKGDTVYCVRHGKGTVRNVEIDTEYCVIVVFEREDQCDLLSRYTETGRHASSDIQPILGFSEHQKIEEVVRPRFRALESDFYLIVDHHGNPEYRTENDSFEDMLFFDCGNYFETLDEAFDSKIYKAYNL